MGFTNTGTRGEPFVASAGNPPTFAADLSGISTFFAARAFREFATVAAMVASTGSAANEWAKADNAPGAVYWTDGTRWYLGNQPVVANAAGLAALFSGTCQPVQGNEVYETDISTNLRYSGSAWLIGTPINTTSLLTTYTSVTATTGTLFTVVLPSLPMASVVDLDFTGGVADTPTGGGDFSLTFAATAGTLTQGVSLANVVSAHYATMSAQGSLALPSGTAATITLFPNFTKQFIGKLKTSRHS